MPCTSQGCIKNQAIKLLRTNRIKFKQPDQKTQAWPKNLKFNDQSHQVFDQLPVNFIS